VRGQRHAPAAPYPPENPVPIVQEVGWAAGPVWTAAENLAPTGIRSRTVQPIASRYTDYATRPTNLYYGFLINILMSCRSNVELNSSGISIVPSPIPSSNQNVIIQSLCWSFLMADFELRILKIFWKINLDHTVGIENNDSDSRSLIFSCFYTMQ
jgi:hypothetical protein